MMKLVTKLYDENSRGIVVKDDMIEVGYYFSDSSDLATDADLNVFAEFEKQRDDENNEDPIRYFPQYLEEMNIEFSYMPSEKYATVSEVEKLLGLYKYYYNSFDDSLDTIENNFYMDEVQYLNYHDGHNWVQEELDGVEDIELIDSDIDSRENNQKNRGQYDLYRKEDGTLLLVFSSFYAGTLDYVEEEITENELIERFEYQLTK